MIDMTGRGKKRTYNTIGKPYLTKNLQYELTPYQQLDYPLRPQRCLLLYH